MGKKQDGEKSFDLFYSKVYGDRWGELKKSLLGDKDHIVLKNPLASPSENLASFQGLPNLFHLPPGGLINPPGEHHYYFMDPASAYAALSLEVQASDKVLDLCAAPGGKSLIMAYLLGKEGSLTANDKSQDRRLRMLQNFRDFLGPERVEKQIRVTGFDAGAWCLHETEAYDKILLDAPCSSERHILESPTHLKEWREGRTKRLSSIQWTMLASAWLVLKTGGRLVYSTCSISPLENDQVVAKLVKKFGEQVTLIPSKFEGGEPTEFGTLFLPDKTQMGPLYFSLLHKTAPLR